MSYSVLYTIDNNFRMTPYYQFANSWGSGPVVWDTLGGLYEKNLTLEPFVPRTFALWEAIARQGFKLDLRWFEYNTLLWGNACHVHKREDFEILSQSLLEFQKYVSPGRVSHLPKSAEILMVLKDDPNVLGVCYYGTSTSENHWVDRETDQYRVFTAETIPFIEARRP